MIFLDDGIAAPLDSLLSHELVHSAQCDGDSGYANLEAEMISLLSPLDVAKLLDKAGLDKKTSPVNLHSQSSNLPDQKSTDLQIEQRVLTPQQASEAEFLRSEAKRGLAGIKAYREKLEREKMPLL